MYPVTGASGGAIRSPCERMPHQFVRREPCHSSARLPTAAPVNAAFSPSREMSYACSSSSVYVLCVGACEFAT